MHTYTHVTLKQFAFFLLVLTTGFNSMISYSFFPRVK